MSYGKEVCKKLKEIRQQIADKNEIAYTTDECHFDGECQGTCPKCDAELRYIETELHKRKHFGKAAAVAGISLGVAMSFLNCEKPLTGAPKPPTAGDIPPDSTYTNNEDSSSLMGMIYEEYASKDSLP
ncbi:MAG: hypothetical protein FWH36_03625 [Lentimicrobiaceae bacterium]|nr:hypothetical protein [Lentimicrobiaceae bacterium]